MKKTILTMAMSASLLSISSAHAFLDSVDLNGVYLGGGLGKATADCTLNTSLECDDAAWKVFGGYKVNDMFAVEAGYYNLGEHEYKATQNNTAIDATTETSGFGVAGVMNYQVADQIDVFGKAGVMSWTADTKKEVGAAKMGEEEASGTDLLLGAGANYHLNENLGIRGEYEYVGGDLKASMYTVGATYSTF